MLSIYKTVEQTPILYDDIKQFNFYTTLENVQYELVLTVRYCDSIPFWVTEFCLTKLAVLHLLP